MIGAADGSCGTPPFRYSAGRQRDARSHHHRLGDADPVRRDRPRRLAGLGPGAALERRLPLLWHVLPHRDRDHGWLPSPSHPPRLQSQALAARPAGDPRLGRDRGPGDLLGSRPPQAPRLLRRRGGSAQPPRRPRPRLERRPARPLPRPHGLALHPHPARQQGTFRSRPDQGPDDQLGRPNLLDLGDRRPDASLRPRLGDRRHPLRRAHRPALGRPRPRLRPPPPTASTRSATSSATATTRPPTSRATSP
jgi:hypothetical protein